MNAPRPAAGGGTFGSALISVLAVLALLCIVVVSLAVTMQYEVGAAHFFNQRAQADFMVREAIESAKATLYSSTTNAWWVSMPGQIVTFAGGPVTNALYSGAATSVNLNRTSWSSDSLPVIDPSQGAMSVDWAYVQQDGTVKVGTPNVAQSSNPVVGRFAYWVDDESARIDLNTAGGRTANTDPDSHPDKIELEALGWSAPQIAQVRQAATNSVFNSPDEARRLPGMASLISSNRFALTHYTHSDVALSDPWGNARIVLTTQASLTNGTGSTNFLNILTKPNTDPGTLAAISQTGLTTTLSGLVNAMSSNWPYFPQKTFASKYPSTAPNQNLTQIALDIIEYVRSVESTNVVVEPIRLHATGPTTYDFTSLAGTGTLIGTTRRPMFTEIGASLRHYLSGGTNMFEVAPFFEIYVPPGYNFPGLVTLPAGTAINFNCVGTGFTIANLTIPVPSPLNSGYNVISSVTTNVAGTTGTLTSFRARAYISPPGSGTSIGYPVWDAVPVDNINLLGLPFAANPGSGLALAGTLQTGDPRLNRRNTDWVASTTSSLGQQNPNYLATAPGTLPPQDTDSSGAVSTASFYLPGPKGSASNPLGRVKSVAELGYIPTGLMATPGVPWRSIRLQPSGSADNPPDWALLDLFVAPPPVTNSLYVAPVANTLAGRINLNTVGVPFTNSLRTLPLQALFQNATNMGTSLTAADAATLATNVASRNFADQGSNRTGLPFYQSVGELAEIRGVADQGEASEALLRQVADLATVRANVFRIYALGQALKQTSSGALVVESEKYIEVIVERVPPTGNLRVIFWKQLPL